MYQKGASSATELRQEDSDRGIGSRSKLLSRPWSVSLGELRGLSGQCENDLTCSPWRGSILPEQYSGSAEGQQGESNENQIGRKNIAAA